MGLAVVHTRASQGLDAPPVRVEVHVAAGLPGMVLVGLVEAAVRESRERVRAAIINSGFRFPDRRITVSLAPADLPKLGSRYDLPIAIGILAASGQIDHERLDELEFYGELALAGEVRPVSGLLPAMRACAACRRLPVLPASAGGEAMTCLGLKALGADSLGEVARFLAKAGELKPPRVATDGRAIETQREPDLVEVQGQLLARRGLEIAAAGGHHLLLQGPPGTGKSFLARTLPGLLPPMAPLETMDTACLYSLAGLPWNSGTRRPFRAPHHSATGVALGGGTISLRPGEVSLAHNGVLFLDEWPEFRREASEILREPLETGRVSLARGTRSVTLPAQFQMVAAMNPCPCGFAGDPVHECRCTPGQVNRYRGRLSGPLMDRVDLQVNMARETLVLSPAAMAEGSAAVRDRVAEARAQQLSRQGSLNAQMEHEQLRRHCYPDPEGEALLDEACRRMALSMRASLRVLRVARTIADLARRQTLDASAVSEALAMRCR